MQKLNRGATFLSLAAAAIGLAVLAYLGFYNRYWADDWCYSTDTKHQGIVTAVVGNYFTNGADAHRGYATNRYSLTLFSGLLYLPGMFGTQILPLLTIVLWWFGLIWIGRNLTHQSGSFTTTPIIVSASGFLLFYTLYISPDRFQSLYFRSGVLTYSAALIFGLYILGLITSQLTREHASKTITYIAALVSFIGGGFSEIGCALLFSSLTLLLLTAWWGKRNSKEWAVKTYSTILTAWIFLLLALIVLAISPSNSRYGDINKEPSNLFLVPFISFRYAFDFILYSILGLPLPHAVVVMAFFGLGILSDGTGETKSDTGNSAWLILVTILATFLLVAAIHAPTTYLYNAPPDPRGQALARFVSLAGMGIAAWILGGMLSARLVKSLMPLPAILLLLCSVYTARATLNVYRELPGFVERAQLWDAREAQIESAIAQGMKRIEITAIDTNDIKTRDIIRTEAFGRWVTDACGVKYYDLDAMRVAP